MEVQVGNQGDYNDQQYYNNVPELNDPRVAGRPITQNESFMRELFAFRKEVIEPLRYVWRGFEYDHDKQQWIKYPTAKPIMNDKGISWAISMIESYVNAVFVVSEYDEKHFNFEMKEAARVIWNYLGHNLDNFELDKLNYPRVANEIESKIKAILLGAKDGGFRTFFTKQSLYQYQEMHNNMQNGMQRPGLFSSVFGIFKKRE